MRALYMLLNGLRGHRSGDLPAPPVSVPTRDLAGAEAARAMRMVAVGLRDFRANKASVGWSGINVNERGT